MSECPTQAPAVPGQSVTAEARVELGKSRFATLVAALTWIRIYERASSQTRRISLAPRAFGSMIDIFQYQRAVASDSRIP